MKFIVETKENFWHGSIHDNQKPIEDDRLKFEEIDVIDPVTNERYKPKKRWIIELETLEELIELKTKTKRELHIQTTHLNKDIPVIWIDKLDYVYNY